jgi:hypothetical protein
MREDEKIEHGRWAMARFVLFEGGSHDFEIRNLLKVEGAGDRDPSSINLLIF